ncbi:UNVERIFIED_CONTAM: DeSI-like protein [Sesamum radiatum]|uniref:DeSI-like protein n=1 Tax=Sesamum radiatum TaxID=300843 RepID=A0AAW2SHR1_SESRA
MNGYFYWAGLGIFHSGVEVEPRQCPGFQFRKSIFIGTTSLDATQVREFMERQAASYNGDTYHLIVKNCNHFCKDICYKLTGKRIPKWVNRLAKLGKFSSLFASKKGADCKAFFKRKRKLGEVFVIHNQKDTVQSSTVSCPKPLNTAVQHDPKYQAYDDSNCEKRRLRSTFSCLSSISSRQKQLSTSSLLLQSPLKGCLPPWELKRSANGSLKER